MACREPAQASRTQGAGLRGEDVLEGTGSGVGQGQADTLLGSLQSDWRSGFKRFNNPPPKVVQGYKFNVFYPDLIDKSKAPVYHINPDPDGNPELCVIRFSAGPPYEDIAFKVVNREWEYSHKKGYKCTFDRGVLHLFFNFKRHRYRR